MLDVRNRTPYPVALVPTPDALGTERATVVIKGTFDRITRGSEPTLSEEQVPISHVDVFHGDPASSSLAYEADVSPAKPATDVVLVGHACAPRAVIESEVSLSVGPVAKTVRVVGDRHYAQGAAGWRMSEPAPFVRMPLRYERAFGGSDHDREDPARRDGDERNPVGTGWSLTARGLEGLALPNLEDPRAPIRGPEDRPPPAGFGFIGRAWLPRRRYAGTYDEAWRRDRCPLLPLDFDERYFNGAHPDLVTRGHLSGGEPVRVRGASPTHRDLAFTLPRRALSVVARVRGERSRHRAQLDTVLIEPDEGRVVLTWRVTFMCPRSFLLIDYVRVAEDGG